MRRRLLLTMLLLTISAAASAADAYFVRFNALGRPAGAGNLVWVDDILLFNTNASPATVHFVGVSNGVVQPNPGDLTLLPGRTISVNATGGVTGGWTPLSSPPLWILHLDIPPGVVAESRDEFYVTFGIPELFPVSRGKVSMPIFRTLTPPNQPQVHLGTDLGETDSHINVGIYNAGSDPATAAIEVRRACDDTVVATQTVTVRANTVIQIGDLGIGSSDECTASLTSPAVRTVIVIVDQPSLTFVSNVNDNVQRAPGEIGVVPIVGLAAAINQQF